MFQIRDDIINSFRKMIFQDVFMLIIIDLGYRVRKNRILVFGFLGCC